MDTPEVLDIARDAIMVMLKIGAPIMVIALLIGLGISLVQALTQIQEATLSFVPKILVMFVSLLLLLPFMIATLSTFTERLADRIASLS
jgi:flagellar biosynthetic protein FliQ